MQSLAKASSAHLNQAIPCNGNEALVLSYSSFTHQMCVHVCMYEKKRNKQDHD